MSARRCGLLVCVLVVWLGSLAIAQDDKDEPRAVSNRSSVSRTSQGWRQTSDYEVSGYARRPDPSVLAFVNVQWQRPEIDQLGNTCTIAGQLRIPGENPKDTRPVDWFQGVTIYMAGHPSVRRDWSKGTDVNDTRGMSSTLSGSGRFEVSIDLRTVEYDRKLEQPFQFGLALATHTVTNPDNQRVLWSSKTPAVSSTVRLLTVPAAPPLSHELELINQASGWPFSNHDGIALIRAVNALSRLGKQEALVVLEEYVYMTEDYSFRERDIVFWIIRLLFEPIRSDDRIPPPANAVYLISRDDSDAALWPLNPIDLIEDIPFMVGHQIGMGGRPEHPSSHTEWAHRHAVIRDKPLRPTAHPIRAADALLRSRKYARLGEDGLPVLMIASIRSQAMAMVEGILEPLPERRRDEAGEQADWDARLKQAQQLGITWDEKAERFVAAKR